MIGGVGNCICGWTHTRGPLSFFPLLGLAITLIGCIRQLVTYPKTFHLSEQIFSPIWPQRFFISEASLVEEFILMVENVHVDRYRISGNFRVAKFLRISRILAKREIFFREISQCACGPSCTRQFANFFFAKSP